MNARDELADVFTGHPVVFGGYPKKLMRGHAQEIAEIILAAGFRKPRTIRSHQERALLKPGTICMDLNGNAWKRGTGSWVSTGGDTGPLYDEDDLTLTVLYEGEK
jgi:hypothetical protein